MKKLAVEIASPVPIRQEGDGCSAVTIAEISEQGEIHLQNGVHRVFLEYRLWSLVQYHYHRNRHLSSVHDAEDLFQDAWIDLQQTQSDTIGDCSPEECEHQLRQAVGRAAERAFEKLRKRVQRGNANVVPLGLEPAESLQDFSRVVDLKHQIESLPADERLVIEMLRSGFDGMEIAKQLELSPQAVTRRKQRAIEKLRLILGGQP